MHRILAILLLSLPVRAAAEVPTVVTDIPPVQSIAAQVMGDLGTPEPVIEGLADPHHVQLRPSEARRLSAADLVVWVGPELTPWLDSAVQGVAAEARSLTLLHSPGTTERAPLFADAEAGGHDEDHAHGDDHGHAEDHGHEHAEDHGHDHEHAQEDGHGHDDDHAREDGHGHAHGDDHAHDHAHGGVDPHAWLDPMNGAAWARTIAAALAEEDPQNAESYRRNADAFAARMAEVAEEAATILAAAADTAVIVQHDAYAHFADRFGLTVAGTIADTEAAAPGAASLSRLSERLKAGGIACIFTEPGQPPALAERLSKDTGVPIAALDPLGTSLPPGPELYQRTILSLAESWAACAGG